MEKKLPCEPCPVEMRSRCAQCVSTMKSIIPNIPTMIRTSPMTPSPSECFASQMLWRRANNGDRMEADWGRMRNDIRSLWAEAMSSWMFSDFNMMVESCDSDDGIRSLMARASDEMKKIRRLFGFCVEIAKLSKLMVRVGQSKCVDLNMLLSRLSHSDVDERFNEMIIEGPLPTIRSDENKWTLIMIEAVRGGFGPKAKIHVSSTGNSLILRSDASGMNREKRTTSSPRQVNLYRTERMLSWDRCEMRMDEGVDGVHLTISLSDDVLGNLDDDQFRIPLRCSGCTERVSFLYEIYSSMIDDEEDPDLPDGCPVKAILSSAARMKRMLFREWDTIASNVERAARDASEPINAVIRMMSSILEEPDGTSLIGHPMLTSTIEKMLEINKIMLMLKELNEIAFVDGDLFGEGASFRATSLDSVIDEAVQENRDLVAMRKARIDVSSNMPSVNIRRNRWVRLFSEMINNSVTYNDSETPVVSITFDGKSILVSDNGIGIPREKWSVVFDIFTSLRSGRHAEISGEHHGIGLFLVKRYAQWDGGNVRIASSDDDGTTMEITLP